MSYASSHIHKHFFFIKDTYQTKKIFVLLFIHIWLNGTRIFGKPRIIRLTLWPSGISTWITALSLPELQKHGNSLHLPIAASKAGLHLLSREGPLLFWSKEYRVQRQHTGTVGLAYVWTCCTSFPEEILLSVPYNGTNQTATIEAMIDKMSKKYKVSVAQPWRSLVMPTKIHLWIPCFCF